MRNTVHKWPGIPDQETILDPYSPDTPRATSQLLNLFNCFSSHNSPDVLDISSSLPKLNAVVIPSGTVNTYLTGISSDASSDLSGLYYPFKITFSSNDMTVGPGIAILNNRIVEITSNTRLIMNSDASGWIYPSSTYGFESTFPTSNGTYEVILCLYQHYRYCENPVLGLIKKTDWNWSSFWSSYVLPIKHISITVSSGNVTSASEVLETNSNTELTTPTLELDVSGTNINFVSFPYYRKYIVDGGYPITFDRSRYADFGYIIRDYYK